MIENFIELLREVDKGSWVELEHDDKYVCIDGHFDVSIIEAWLAEVKAEAWEEGMLEGQDNYYGSPSNPYRQDV